MIEKHVEPLAKGASKHFITDFMQHQLFVRKNTPSLVFKILFVVMGVPKHSTVQKCRLAKQKIAVSNVENAIHPFERTTWHILATAKNFFLLKPDNQVYTILHDIMSRTHCLSKQGERVAEEIKRHKQCCCCRLQAVFYPDAL